MRYALFKEVRKPERRKKRKLNHGAGTNAAGIESDDSDSEDDNDNETNATSQRMQMPSKSQLPVPSHPVLTEPAADTSTAPAGAPPR